MKFISVVDEIQCTASPTKPSGQEYSGTICLHMRKGFVYVKMAARAFKFLSVDFEVFGKVQGEFPSNFCDFNRTISFKQYFS